MVEVHLLSWTPFSANLVLGSGSVFVERLKEITLLHFGKTAAALGMNVKVSFVLLDWNTDFSEGIHQDLKGWLTLILGLIYQRPFLSIPRYVAKLIRISSMRVLRSRNIYLERNNQLVIFLARRFPSKDVILNSEKSISKHFATVFMINEQFAYNGDSLSIDCIN